MRTSKRFFTSDIGFISDGIFSYRIAEYERMYLEYEQIFRLSYRMTLRNDIIDRMSFITAAI